MVLEVAAQGLSHRDARRFAVSVESRLAQSVGDLLEQCWRYRQIEDWLHLAGPILLRRMQCLAGLSETVILFGIGATAADSGGERGPFSSGGAPRRECFATFLQKNYQPDPSFSVVSARYPQRDALR